mgnify:CR=1 FL=1
MLNIDLKKLIKEYGIFHWENKEYGIWNMEYGIWNMKYRIWNREYPVLI